MPGTGRFAPTPSGPLHFGSLVAALASYCQARAAGGRWLLRIEDVDTPRVIEGAEDEILTALEACGFEWDETPWRQSARFEIYRGYLERLIDNGDCFACECSRASLRKQGVSSGPLGQIYPGNCRTKQLAPAGHSMRLDTSGAGRIGFEDLVYGRFELDLEAEVGDFVLRRADGIYAYHLAVVVDDYLQGIDEVVRGADLLENTCLHLLLQRKLDLPAPRYLHFPLVNDIRGQKLSKQTGASAIDTSKAPLLLLAALRHLGQSPEPGLVAASSGEILEYAIEHWDPRSIPRKPAALADNFES